MSNPDFAALDGETFEELCEDLFKAMGFVDPPPERSGRGPDGGRDLIVVEHRKSGVSGVSRPFRWLVQCKNPAESNRSVRPQDAGPILDKLSRHEANGYLLVTSTIPSSDLEADIMAIDRDVRYPVEATYWARPRLIDEVRKQRNVYEKYFGSANRDVVRSAHWSRRNPFVELFPYDEVMSGYFFGREADTRKILEGVYRSSVVLLCGESGVGKTSLINAGLLPALHEEGTITLSIAVKSAFSSQDLFDRLWRVWSALPGVDAGSPHSLDTLSHSLARDLRSREQKLVVVLDQFENLFLTDEDVLSQVGRDLANALSAANRFGSVAFLVSLRSDYLEELAIWAQESQIPELWVNVYPLPRLSATQAAEILVKVPPIVNAEFSPEVISSILADLGDLYQSEIYPSDLQIVASRVFDEARDHADPDGDELVIRQEDYEAVGTARGILEAFLDDRLARFGQDRDIARAVLLALVSATGRRLNLSVEAIAAQVSLDPGVLWPVLERLAQARLVKPTDQPHVFELVHDVLATRILEITGDELRKAKAAKEAFELAFTAWQSEGVPESGHKLDWYYEHRQTLNLDIGALVFLLLSETITIVRSDPFSGLWASTRGTQEAKRGRWIEAVDPAVCLQALDRVLELGEAGRIDQAYVRDIASDVCRASSFEVQRELVAKLEALSPRAEDALLAQAYRNSPFPTQATLSYLQNVALRGLPLDVRRTLVFRILEHYRSTLSSFVGRRQEFETTTEEWRRSFPVYLLSDRVFQDTIFRYLRENAEPRPRRNISRYKLELLRMLYEHDPDRTIEALWEIAQRDLYIGGSLYLGSTAQDVLRLLREYDPERTVDEIVAALKKETRYHRSESIAFLESVEAPEADDLLVANIQRYADKFEKGSKTWRGRSLRYWRKSLMDTVDAAARRKLSAVLPSLITIVLRHEPANVKLSCVEAIAAMGSEKENWPAFVRLLNDRSAQVRKACAKHLSKMKEFRHQIAEEVARSLGGGSEIEWPFLSNRHKDVMATKIRLLRRLQEPSTIEPLESIAVRVKDKETAELAYQAAAALRAQ
jgi:energy-coupling factor transporter ATP-binding protein EcfA2